MKKLYISLMICSLSIGALFAQLENLKSIAPPRAEFSVTPVDLGLTYTPNSAVAVWVESAEGTFINTLAIKTQIYKVHLIKWADAAGGTSGVDAITAATLTTYDKQTFAWNCRDKAGKVVQNGNYRFYIEMTQENSAGPGDPGAFTSVEFTKDDTSSTFTFNDQTYFKDMEVVYTAADPSNIIDEVEKSAESFTVYPNPFEGSAEVVIEGMENQSKVVKLYDLKGQLMFSRVLSNTENSFVLEIHDLPKGVFILEVANLFGEAKSQRIIHQ